MKLKYIIVMLYYKFKLFVVILFAFSQVYMCAWLKYFNQATARCIWGTVASLPRDMCYDTGTEFRAYRLVTLPCKNKYYHYNIII